SKSLAARPPLPRGLARRAIFVGVAPRDECRSGVDVAFYIHHPCTDLRLNRPSRIKKLRGEGAASTRDCAPGHFCGSRHRGECIRRVNVAFYIHHPCTDLRLNRPSRRKKLSGEGAAPTREVRAGPFLSESPSRGMAT